MHKVGKDYRLKSTMTNSIHTMYTIKTEIPNICELHFFEFCLSKSGRRYFVDSAKPHLTNKSFLASAFVREV